MLKCRYYTVNLFLSNMQLALAWLYLIKCFDHRIESTMLDDFRNWMKNVNVPKFLLAPLRQRRPALKDFKVNCVPGLRGLNLKILQPRQQNKSSFVSFESLLALHHIFFFPLTFEDATEESENKPCACFLYKMPQIIYLKLCCKENSCLCWRKECFWCSFWFACNCC